MQLAFHDINITVLRVTSKLTLRYYLRIIILDNFTLY
jgi:hypothetical protein